MSESRDRCSLLTPHFASETISALVSGINDLSRSIAALETAEAHHADGDAFAHARHISEHVIPAILAVRQAADHLESIVENDLCHLPTYPEMLFIR